MLAISDATRDHLGIVTAQFHDGPWRNVRRYGVGMIADLLRHLVERVKQTNPGKTFASVEAACLSVRIYAAGGNPGSTDDREPGPDPAVLPLAEFAHGAEVRALLWRRGPSPLRVTDCLQAAFRCSVDIDLPLHEAKWRLLDRTHGCGLPDQQRLAFEAAWLANNRRFALLHLLQPFLRSAEGKAWIADTPPAVLDEPLERLVDMRDSLIGRRMGHG